MPRMRTLMGGLVSVAVLGSFGVFLSWPEMTPGVGFRQYLGHEALTPAPTRPPFGFDYPAVVEKTAVSYRMRLIFLVGLEGTGHHYLNDVLDEICDAAAVPPRNGPVFPCPNTCPLADALYPRHGPAKTAEEYEDRRRDLRREMENLAGFAKDSLRDGEATLASFGRCRPQAGQMSYPNYDGEDKAIQYVDFRLLAEEAERAAVDVRFVYLVRPARATIVSDTRHMGYGGTFMREIHILLNNAAVVESYFGELDPGFTACFEFDQMSDPKQAGRVASFVAPTDVVAKVLGAKMLAGVKTRPPATRPQARRLPASGPQTAGVVMRAPPELPEPPERRLDRRDDWRHQELTPHRRQLRHRGGDSIKATRTTEHRAVPESPKDSAATGRILAKDPKVALMREAVKEEAAGVVGLPMELLVARLQQKLDKIERDVCSTAFS